MFSILINHCWCSDSIWGGKYNCRVIARLDRIPVNKSYYDTPNEDWTNLLVFDETYLQLKPEVHQWLEQNIPVKGWAIGTDKYNSIDELSFSFFFQKLIHINQLLC